ncbi:hypothetical protein MP228_003335 [Amoeboaphelidium protococcarum]|nr:hypothetical protein MP228_003335 [Amoeboaphelidium protococcarum]
MQQMSLEQTVENFFDSKIPYDQKAALESQLQQWKIRPQAWREAVNILQGQSSQNMQWFALSMVEESLLRHWEGITDGEQEQLKQFCLNILERHNQNGVLSLMSSNKLIKVIVDLAKRMWPHRFPELLPLINKCILSPPLSPTGKKLTKSLHAEAFTGLSLLKTLLEEFLSAGNKPDMSSARKQELKHLLFNENAASNGSIMSGVLHLLKITLDGIYGGSVGGQHGIGAGSGGYNVQFGGSAFPQGDVKHQRSISADGREPSYQQAYLPSPQANSPTPQYNQSQVVQMALNLSSVNSRQLLTSPISITPRGQFDSESRELCVLTLDILVLIFTHIPLDTVSGQQCLNIYLLDTVFKLVHVNDSTSVEIGNAALSCISELLLRKFMPPQSNEYVTVIFLHIYEVLKHLTDDSDNSLMDDLDDEYRSRFAELLTLFMQNCLGKIERLQNLPLPNLLELMYKFTMQQPDVLAFRECLLIWHQIVLFIQYSQETLQSPTSRLQLQIPQSQTHQKLKQGMLMLSLNLLAKMQYTVNPSFLQDIEDAVENSSGQTDMDMYIDECLSILEPTLKLYPQEVIQVIWEMYERQVATFQQIIAQQQQQQQGMQQKSLSESAHIMYSYKDLRTSTKIVGHLAEVFVDNFEASLDSTFSLLLKFLNVISNCLNGYATNQEHNDYIKLCTESYLVIQSYVFWLTTLQQKVCGKDSNGGGNIGNKNLLPKFDELTQNILSACIAVFRPGMSKRVQLAASQVLQSICITVKPQNLFSYGDVGNFVSNIHQICQDIPHEVKANIYFGVSSALLNLLPHLNNETTQEYAAFVSGVVDPFKQLLNQASSNQSVFANNEIQDRIAHVLVILSSILKSVECEKAAVRQILYSTIRDVVGPSAQLLNVYNQNEKLLFSITSFLLQLVTCVKRQIAPEQLVGIVQQLLSVFNEQTVAALLNDINEECAHILNNVFSIMNILVEDPSSSSKVSLQILPDVCQFCIGRCAPVLQQIDTGNAILSRPVFFELIKSIVVNQWKLIYPNDNSSAVGGSSFSQQVALFDGLISILLNAFQSTSPDLVKADMQVLIEINNKCKLFSTAHFRQDMFTVFVRVILSVLVDKSHDLLRDELIHFLFVIASSSGSGSGSGNGGDLQQFYTQAVPLFLQDKNDVSVRHRQLLLESMKPVRDSPSFTLGMNQFVDDLLYYSRIDSSDDASSQPLMSMSF